MSKIIVPSYNIAFRFMLLALLLPTVFICKAQSTRKILKAGDASYQRKDFYNAVKYYTAILYDSPLAKQSANTFFPYQSRPQKWRLKAAQAGKVYYQLAESYRQLNDFSHAIGEYEKYLSTGDRRFPLASLWYGNALLNAGEPQKALPILTSFHEQYTPNDENKKRAALLIASCNYALKLGAESPVATITAFVNTTSGDGSNFAMQRVNDSVFWFSSSRQTINKKTPDHPVAIYTGDIRKDSVKRLVVPAEPGLNMGAASLSSDGLTVFFTGWKEGESYQIYCMTRASVQSTWSKPLLLPAPLNKKGYDFKQPSISRDGSVLFFASNQPGGQGGYDIWWVTMNGYEVLGQPTNAGPILNSFADDVSPNYQGTDSLLYFSSDGRVGLGGFDVFQSKGNISTNEWTQPVNVGAPINSPKNDLYYQRYAQTDTAYVSSDRHAGCCLELFSAIRLPFQPVVSKDSSVKRTDSLQKTISVPDKPLLLPTGDSIQMQQSLMDSINTVLYDRASINYRFASAKIRAVDQPVLDAMIKTMNAKPELNILIASFTDCIGSKAANERLSKRRSEAVKEYLLNHGISASRINTDFFGKRYFLKACREDNTYDLQQQLTNRRSDLLLTTEKHPRWQPTGKEIDLANANDQYKINQVDRISIQRVEENNAETTDAAEVNNRKAAKKTMLPAENKPRKVGKQKNGSKNITATSRKAPAIATEKAATSKLDTLGAATTKTNYSRLKINELLDFIPKVKTVTLVDEMTRRIPQKPLYLYSASDSVRVDLYDNGTFDYDSVSVIFNNEVVVFKQLLQTTKAVSFYIKLSSDPQKNQMIFFAENLGLTPPNSALMVITDGENKRTEFNISSDLNHNTVVYFIKVTK